MTFLSKFVSYISTIGSAFFAGKTANKEEVLTYITSLAEYQIQHSTHPASVENATRVLSITKKNISSSFLKQLSTYAASVSNQPKQTGNLLNATQGNFLVSNDMFQFNPGHTVFTLEDLAKMAQKAYDDHDYAKTQQIGEMVRLGARNFYDNTIAVPNYLVKKII